MPDRKRGIVKWFNSSKGYGFIKRDNGDDLFVHHQEIVSDGIKTLNENDNVEFTEVEGPRGPQAYEVKVIN